MPIISAAGGAASKGFGQFAKQGGGGYKNVMLGSQVYSTGAQLTTIYKSDINPYQGVTNFPTSPGSSYYSRNPGVITDGSFIAIAGGAYSIDNGASWSSWSGTSTSSTANNSPSLNGNIAYNPTAKRAAYFAPVTSSKTGTLS